MCALRGIRLPFSNGSFVVYDLNSGLTVAIDHACQYCMST
jgi:hypothetical protein